MITKWITKKYNKNASQLTKKFITAKPYPHVVLHDFLNPAKLEKLRKTLLKELFERIDKDLFSFENTKDLATSKSNIIQEFYNFFSSTEFRKFVEQMTGEKLGSISDMHGHLFKQGDYLLFHDDLVEQRKIAYVINLSKGFTSKDGGRFMMYNMKKPQKPAIVVLPEFNTVVCFKVSTKTLHAVEEVLTNKKRLSIGGWFYGNQ